MDSKLIKSMIDSFEKVGMITSKMPDLPQGITPAYLKIIDCIYTLSKDEDHIRISDIAEKMKISVPGITRSIKAMESLKVVEKKTNPKDKREVFIFLTSSGINIYKKYDELYYKKLSRIMKNYPEENIKNMIKTINDVEEIMTNNPVNLEG